MRDCERDCCSGGGAGGCGEVEKEKEVELVHAC